MKRWFVLVSLLLPGLIVGCASDSDVRALRTDTLVLERQRSELQQTVEARLQTVGDRVAQFEKTQAETRRELARTTATLDELRIHMQRLQGDIQETQHRVRRGTNGETGSSTKLADMETRLNALEQQLTSRRSTTPPSSTATEPAPSSPAPPVAANPVTPSLPVPPPPPPPGPPPQPRVAAVPPASSVPPPAAESHVADQLYQRGIKEYREGNYDSAIVNFRQFLKQASKSPQAGNAQYLIGEALYAQKQYDPAIVAFDDVVQKYPKDPKVAAAMLKEGYAFAELKDARNARYFLQQVLKKFPDSPEAQKASEKLKQLR